ncbi:MAG: lamin tail domain-containing protein [Candidatus Woesearchaeota archaeon]
MRKIVLFLLLLAPQVAAGVVINEVFYNPTGSDTGKEFVELYNDGPDSVSLKDFILESGNGANPNDWTVEWTGTTSEVIPANGYFLIAESNVSAVSNFVTELDLQNGPDAVRLRINSTVVDLVGYGSLTFPEYYEGSPASVAREGFSIARVGPDTDNNLADFAESVPTPQSSSQNSIVVMLNVVEPAVEFVSLSVSDDDSDAPGVQVVPIAASTKQVQVSAVIRDSDGASGSSVACQVDGRSYQLALLSNNFTHATFSGNLEMRFFDPAGNYTVVFSAASGSKTGSAQLAFEYLALAAIVVDTSSLNFSGLPNTLLQAIGDSDMSTGTSSTVHNVGNVDIELGIRGSDFVSSQGSVAISNMELCLGTSFSQDTLSVASFTQYIPSLIVPDSAMPLSYRMYIPQSAPAGSYAGALFVSARTA